MNRTRGVGDEPEAGGDDRKPQRQEKDNVASTSSEIIDHNISGIGSHDSGNVDAYLPRISVSDLLDLTSHRRTQAMHGDFISPNVPALSPEQKDLAQKVVFNTKRCNVFCTGVAGSGKSTVLKFIINELRLRGVCVHVIATTEQAALQAGGMTLHEYAGWRTESQRLGLGFSNRIDEKINTLERLSSTNVLIIDEVNTVHASDFQRLSDTMKDARNRWAPFGGCIVVAIGDFHQLPPSKPFEYCSICSTKLTVRQEDQIYFCEYHDCFCAKKKWAFQCRAWERCNFFHYELKTIHRQRDQIFTGILQKIRVGDALSYGQTNLFMNHVSAVENTTRIVPTDGEAREINQCKFGQLNTELVTYKCLDNFQWNKKRHPNLESKGTRLEDGSLLALSHHRCERQLELKPGTYVVYIGSNKPLKSTQGVIREFRPFDTKNPPYSEPGKKRLFAPRGLCEAHVPVWDSQIHKYIDSAEKKMWPVVEFLDGKTEVIYAECEFLNVGNTMPYSTLTRTQIPLVPAWSMSVNQCLSLTLDRIIVDLSKAWEEGQLYMALSRASALKGLRVEGDPKDLVAGKGGNPDAKDFYDSFDIGTLFWGI